ETQNDNALTDAQKTIEELKRDKENIDTELVNVKQQLQEANEKIKAKENELEVVNEDLKSEQLNTEDKNNEIERLNGQITELQTKIVENNLVIANSVSQEDYNGAVAERNRRPNISQAEYEKVVAERDEYSKRPTKGQLDNAAENKKSGLKTEAEVNEAVNNARRQETDKYKDHIDPNNFAEVARQKGYKSKDEVDAEVAKETE
ncbi:26826_t:CDS:2, partial [Racocetra persica]